jgi:hypothetical protein
MCISRFVSVVSDVKANSVGNIIKKEFKIYFHPIWGAHGSVVD